MTVGSYVDTVVSMNTNNKNCLICFMSQTAELSEQSVIQREYIWHFNSIINSDCVSKLFLDMLNDDFKQINKQK